MSLRQFLHLYLSPVVIVKCIVNNRQQCGIAVAIREKFPDARYIKVDYNEASYTLDGVRWSWALPRTALRWAQQLDREGKDRLKPLRCSLKFISSRVIPPPATRERKDQINAARKARIAAGIPDQKYAQE